MFKRFLFREIGSVKMKLRSTKRNQRAESRIVSRNRLETSHHLSGIQFRRNMTETNLPHVQQRTTDSLIFVRDGLSDPNTDSDDEPINFRQKQAKVDACGRRTDSVCPLQGQIRAMEQSHSHQMVEASNHSEEFMDEIQQFNLGANDLELYLSMHQSFHNIL